MIVCFKTNIMLEFQFTQHQQLRDAIVNSSLYDPLPPSSDVDDMFANYDAVLRDIADRFAPEHDVRIRLRPLSPWFDADCRAARNYCRRLEHRYRRSLRPSRLRRRGTVEIETIPGQERRILVGACTRRCFIRQVMAHIEQRVGSEPVLWRASDIAQ